MPATQAPATYVTDTKIEFWLVTGFLLRRLVLSKYGEVQVEGMVIFFSYLYFGEVTTFVRAHMGTFFILNAWALSIFRPFPRYRRVVACAVIYAVS